MRDRTELTGPPRRPRADARQGDPGLADRLLVARVSEQAFLVRLGDAVSPAIAARIQAAVGALDVAHHPWLVDCVPAFSSLLVVFDPTRETAAAVHDAIVRAARAPVDVHGERRRHLVPVWYDAAVAPDLEDVARLCGLAVREVVARHAARDYLVYALGFKPGFPYMAPVDDLLVTPRLDTPRLAVPAGSVAIAGRQTGIYTVRSPGGWRILGRTPWRIFDPDRPDPFRIKAGDEVRFQPIDRETFLAMERNGRGGR